MPAKRSRYTPPEKVSRELAPKKLRPKAKSQPPSSPRSLCPINLSLELVGDSWSMLIIRDLMLRNHTGYQAFLNAGEKIATNILAERLQRLENFGLISKSTDPSDARKFIYALTEKGAGLAPILVELALFGAKLEPFVEMSKDIMEQMTRNKTTYTAGLMKAVTPKPKSRPQRKSPPSQAEETLSLFDF